MSSASAGQQGWAPPLAIREKLLILADRWIGHNGTPDVKAHLANYLRGVSVTLSENGEPMSLSAAKSLADEVLAVHRAHDIDLRPMALGRRSKIGF